MDAPQDTISQNNQAAVFVNVQGPRHVLVIEGSPGAGRNIVSALQATHIDVNVGVPIDVPTTLEGLGITSAVVLADVPAIDLGTTRMQVFSLSCVTLDEDSLLAEVRIVMVSGAMPTLPGRNIAGEHANSTA